MIGYCCINTSIDKCVNRTMRKATFQKKGLTYVGELAMLNLNDLFHILRWNVKNDIFLYRMSSDMFPWMSEYDFEDLPNYQAILKTCNLIGNYIKTNKIRVSFHPGPFNVLGSQNPNVVKKTIDELTKHAQIMDMMGLEQSHYYPINIHISATKPSKEVVCNTFVESFKQLPQTVKSRLTIENDDKVAQYDPFELYELVYQEVGTPITFDQFHFICSRPDGDIQKALELSLSTWLVKPLTHHSSSRRIESNDPKIKATAHADYIYEPIQSFGHDFDTDLEAKAKDKAVISYRKKFG